MEKQESKSAVNPIDKDKVAANPHLLPYAHTVGGALIKPEDKGRIKGRAVSAMYEQTDMQLDQLRKQFELLAQQAKEIQDRVTISEKIYLADIPFSPLINFKSQVLPDHVRMAVAYNDHGALLNNFQLFILS